MSTITFLTSRKYMTGFSRKALGSLRWYDVDGHLLLALRSLYSYSEVCVCVSIVFSYSSIRVCFYCFLYRLSETLIELFFNERKVVRS